MAYTIISFIKQGREPYNRVPRKLKKYYRSKYGKSVGFLFSISPCQSN